MIRSVNVLKDINEAARTVVFAYSKYMVYDSDKDRVFAGAFDKTTRENGPDGTNRIKHVYNHNRTTLVPIGKPLRMWSDTDYAYTESKMADNQLADDVFKGYMEGTLTEHSFWGKSLNPSKNEMGGYDHKEIKLYEVSTVLWGANEDAKLLSLIKGDQGAESAINERLKDLQKFVRNSSASDDFLETIHVEIEKLQDLFSSLRPPQAPRPTYTSEQLLQLYRML